MSTPAAPARAAVERAASAVLDRTRLRPAIGVILGTGLGQLADAIDVAVSIPYDEIPGFPLSTVESHSGRLLIGHLGGKPVVAMQGRFHLYEGYTAQEITFPVRVMAAMGIETLLVSNAAGGMNPLYRRGDVMLIRTTSTCRAPTRSSAPTTTRGDRASPTCPSPTRSNCARWPAAVALEAGMRLHAGRLRRRDGPQPRNARRVPLPAPIGADVVGMSTVPEIIVARHMGMRTMAVSVVTDECFPDCLAPVALPEILAAADEAQPKLTAIVTGVIERL